ncbi:ATP-binding protein, partial [Nitrospirota bacterium]
SNALKYAFPEGQDGAIDIVLSSDGNSNLLSISDNGIGLPEGIDIEQGSTLGLMLVLSLVSQLNGNLTIGQSEGTSFRVEF